jgi:hypothetical protein
MLTNDHTGSRETCDQTNISPPFVALPDAQESSTDACDIGQDPAELARTCARNGWPVDLSLVHDGWNDKSTPGSGYSPASKAIFRRARDARVFLRNAALRLAAEGVDNVEIVLVAHGGFMHYLTGDWEGAGKYPATGWINCEMRSYHFLEAPDAGVDDLAKLAETEESRRRRGLEGPMITDGQVQRELYARAMEQWEAQGLQNHSKIAGQEDEEDDMSL